MTWPSTKLGDVVEFLDHWRKPITANDRVPGPVPYYGANGQQDSVATALFDEPLVLLAEDGGHFDEPEKGVAYRIDGPSWVNNHAHVLRPRDNLDIGYLTRVLENYDLTPYVSGTTRGKLTKGRAGEIEIPLPPLPEQRRIASILDQVDELRARRRRALAAVELSMASLFDSTIGRPSSNEAKHPRRRIDEIAVARLGKMLDTAKQSGEHRRPYLRNANVQWLSFELSSLAAMDFSPEEQIEFSLQAGDVLVCEGGQPGRCAVWQGEIENVYFQKALHRVRLDTSVMLPDVFVRTMMGLVCAGSLADSISSATISHLTGEKLKKVEIPVPPLALQQAYLLDAQGLEILATSHRGHLAKLDELFASLQHRAFRGEL